MRSQFSLKLFGGASLETSSGPIGGRATQRHRLALLALLARASVRGMSREKAIVYLWPESDATRGRRLLSDAIYRVNQAVEGEAIVAIGSELRLDDRQLPSDVVEFGDAIRRGDWERAIERYQGPFLDGFYLPAAVEFERWTEAERDRLDRDHDRAASALAEAAESAGDHTRAVDWWRTLAARDPLNSRIALRLMQALDASGDRSAAIQYATEHADRLRADLDLEPDPGVAELARTLRRTRGQMRSASSLPPGDRIPFVAVLPFLNLGGGPENDYFTDGITEDVIAHLAKIRAIKVVSLTSAMPFRDRRHTLKEMGTTLGATTILDGSVRQADDRVRIVARLVDIETDQHLWAETYDKSLTDIFSIQLDVALHIASALEAHLSPDEQIRVRREPTKDLQAYRLFLQGRRWFIKFTPESLTQAIEHFEDAIARDPSFALAYAYVAMSYAELVEGGALLPEIGYARAEEAAANALRLDPELSAAHCVRGHLKALREFDWAGAEQAFRRSIELSPGAADTYDLYGRMCAGIGRYDEAIELHLLAEELDPVAHRMDIATTLLRAGRCEEAIARAEAAAELEPDARGLATLGWAYFLGGRREEGLRQIERAASVSPGATLWLSQLGEAYGLAGEQDKALEILRSLDDRTRFADVPHYHYAYVYTGLGDHERALDCLERAAAERYGPIYGIKGSFLLAPLRSHPRFRALLRDINLE